METNLERRSRLDREARKRLRMEGWNLELAVPDWTPEKLQANGACRSRTALFRGELNGQMKLDFKGRLTGAKQKYVYIPIPKTWTCGNDSYRHPKIKSRCPNCRKAHLDLRAVERIHAYFRRRPVRRLRLRQLQSSLKIDVDS